MHRVTIAAIHGYNDWATEHVLTCCDQLSPETFTRETDIPWGSIRNQLVHQFIVHKRWMSWIDGSMSGEDAYALRADPDDYPDVNSVRNMWEDIRRQNQKYLHTATEDDLNRMLRVEFPGSEFAIPTWQVLIHIAHHSMQHRSEVAVALTRAGASPGDVDYIFYALEHA